MEQCLWMPESPKEASDSKKVASAYSKIDKDC